MLRSDPDLQCWDKSPKARESQYVVDLMRSESSPVKILTLKAGAKGCPPHKETSVFCCFYYFPPHFLRTAANLHAATEADTSQHAAPAHWAASWGSPRIRGDSGATETAVPGTGPRRSARTVPELGLYNHRCSVNRHQQVSFPR